MPSRRVFLAARQALTPVQASILPRQYAAMPAGALARSVHNKGTKACSQSVSCRGLAGPSQPAETTAAGGTGSGAGKGSKPFYRRLWFRAAVSIAGGVMAYSWVDYSVFHPPSKDEVYPVHATVHHPDDPCNALFAPESDSLRTALLFSGALPLTPCTADPYRSSATSSWKRAACERSASSSSARAGARPPSWRAWTPSATT
jgi:hypothetical protein